MGVQSKLGTTTIDNGRIVYNTLEKLVSTDLLDMLTYFHFLYGNKGSSLYNISEEMTKLLELEKNSEYLPYTAIEIIRKEYLILIDIYNSVNLITEDKDRDYLFREIGNYNKYEMKIVFLNCSIYKEWLSTLSFTVSGGKSTGKNMV